MPINTQDIFQGARGDWTIPTADGHFIFKPSTLLLSAAAATLDSFQFGPTTITIGGSTNVTTAAGFNYAKFSAPTYTAGGAMTVTSAATLVVSAAPIAGTNVTITNAYAMWVQAGTSRFDGTVSMTGGYSVTGGPITLTPTASVASGASATLDDWTLAATTITVSGNTGITTATGFNFASIKAPTFSAASALTVTNAATLAIQGAPIAGGAGPLAITNAYAIWVQGGVSRFDGPMANTPTTTVASSASATLDAVTTAAATITISGSTNITTATGFNLESIKAPTLSAASALTITNAATFAVSGAPVGGGAGPCAITNAYAVWVQGGLSRFDGPMQFTPTPASITSASGATLDAFTVPATTVTVTGTTAITTAAGFNFASIKQPTFTDASACAVTSGATLAIQGAPIVGGSLTLTNPYALWVQAGASRFDGGVTLTGGVAGGNGLAASSNKCVKLVTGIADASATTVLTITIPNAAHAAAVRLTILASLGAGGAVGAFEESLIGTGCVVFTRTSGASSSAAAATITLTGHANVAGADSTATLAYSVTASAGGAGSTDTHNIQVTITKGGGASANHQALIVAELLNSQGSGVTMA